MREAERRPDEHDWAADRQALPERVRAAAPGLEQLVTTAETTQRQRAASAEAAGASAEAAAGERGAPRWTDVFTTQFTEFSNRPR